MRKGRMSGAETGEAFEWKVHRRRGVKKNKRKESEGERCKEGK